MFDLLFGWRKASKCKRLIRRLQCRLKVLKNKRATVVRQLRDDVAELLKHGHGQTAFDRVEQIFKDECLLAVYEILDNFCEFIISNLYYIRRNKDCPNDINEAMSSLIFASARFGDLPELISIRKLFGERYGQRFATVALELLPGNLVNRQMQKKMSIKSVSDEEKSRLVEEILKSSLQSGPLLLEYSSEMQQKLEDKSNIDPIHGDETRNKANDGNKLQVSNTEKEEEKLGQIDFTAKNKVQTNKAILRRSLMTNFILSSIFSITAPQTPQETVASSGDKKMSPHGTGKAEIGLLERSLVVYDSVLRKEEESANIAETSSESSVQLPEEMVYLDDIQEFESPQSKENNLQDQRLFKFRSSAVPMRAKLEKPKEEEEDLEDEERKSEARSVRKNRNGSAKRHRRRSVSGEAITTSINDLECAIYYGESGESSPNHDQKFHEKQKHSNHKKIPLKHQTKTYIVQEVPNDDQKRSSSNRKPHQGCSLEHPCYTCSYNEGPGRDYKPQEPTIHLKLSRCCCSCRGNCQILAAERGVLLNKKKRDDVEDPRSPNLLISTCSGSSSSSPRMEEKHSYLRAMTMPPERPKDATVEAILRSNSFPFQEHGLSSNGHVHPKLPDYDALAARFIALKKANLQGKR